MTTNKLPKQKQKQPQIPGHPLAKLASKFEGEFWENTLTEIERYREIEKQELNKTLDKQ